MLKQNSNNQSMKKTISRIMSAGLALTMMTVASDLFVKE